MVSTPTNITLIRLFILLVNILSLMAMVYYEQEAYILLLVALKPPSAIYLFIFPRYRAYPDGQSRIPGLGTLLCTISIVKVPLE